MSDIVPFTTAKLHTADVEHDEAGHDRRETSQSGVWTCDAEAITPVCIRSAFDKLSDRDPAFLPGSSLRGMVRNMAEMLGAGCARYYRGNKPRNLEDCTPERACLVCRVFGFVHKDYAWTGKVRFSDSDRAKVNWVKYHAPRDREPAAAGSGWVIFRHERPDLAPGPLRCANRGAKWRFRVEYLNLDAEEYAVFRFALTLERGPMQLAHKLGYAKSLGLGSVRIAIRNPGAAPEAAKLDYYLDQPAFARIKELRSTSK